MPESKFEGQNQGENSESGVDKILVGRIESILAMPKEEWLKTQEGQELMMSFSVNLPGGERYENYVKDNEERTFSERDEKFYTDKYGGADRISKNLTPKKFAEIILDALNKTGVDVLEIEKKNRRISEIMQKIDELDKKRKSKEINRQLHEMAREFSFALADINYDALPAALHLFKQGYKRSEIF